MKSDPPKRRAISTTVSEERGFMTHTLPQQPARARGLYHAASCGGCCNRHVGSIVSASQVTKAFITVVLTVGERLERWPSSSPTRSSATDTSTGSECLAWDNRYASSEDMSCIRDRHERPKNEREHENAETVVSFFSSLALTIQLRVPS